MGGPNGPARFSSPYAERFVIPMINRGSGVAQPNEARDASVLCNSIRSFWLPISASHPAVRHLYSTLQFALSTLTLDSADSRQGSGSPTHGETTRIAWCPHPLDPTPLAPRYASGGRRASELVSVVSGEGVQPRRIPVARAVRDDVGALRHFVEPGRMLGLRI